jgi:uncharacterized RDD family membrane protein YckC
MAIVLYDALLLLAVLFLATALALPLNSGIAFTESQFLYPLYLIFISFVFYGWFWTHDGQTLGLKTWRYQTLTFDRQPITWKQAFFRFCFGFLSWALLGLGFFWIFFDKNNLALHDRLSKTRLFPKPIEKF